MNKKWVMIYKHTHKDNNNLSDKTEFKEKHMMKKISVEPYGYKHL
jgi:hypothetical protein